MSDKVVVEGKRVDYTQIADADVTVERILHYLINGALSAKLARMEDETSVLTKEAKDIIVKTALRR